jgi:two-component system CheB/CheR fusion protein
MRVSNQQTPDSAGIAAAPQRSKGALYESDSGHSPFPIVGIGASAGGLEAFQQLLTHLPQNTGMAFVFVQHLDPHHKSSLSELLTKATAMPVLEARDGSRVEPNHVYIIPPNANLGLAGGILQLTERPEGRALHLPVDFLFHSLAEDQLSRAIGVVLSGTGSDGTQGLCEIKAAGGISFAQDERSAKYDGMPHSAAIGGCADFVMTPEEIARRLADMGGHPYLAQAAQLADSDQDMDAQYGRIIGRVRAVTGGDFSLYRETTIKRRIMRRMALHTDDSLASYVERLQSDAKEVEALYRDLLINVTSFFRDPELFESLKQIVFPMISRNKTPVTPLRVWIPGCSTGQEAYSFAMALVEFFDDKPPRPPIQIFATDLSDPPALERARAGIYPESVELEVTPERLRRFFVKEDHIYRMEKSIREMCVFARQNITSDPPFSHLDVISCRNVLIYLATPLQKRVLPTFHYALNMPGYLVLGTAETVGESNELFDIVDRNNKIYRKREAPARPYMRYKLDDINSPVAPVARRFGPAASPSIDFQREADRILLGRYSPPGVLITENFDIIQFRGRTSRYLEHPPGEPTNNLLKIAREGLFLEVRSAVAEARAQDKPVMREHVRLRADGELRLVNVEVVPVKSVSSGSGCFMVLFHEDGGRPQEAAAESATARPGSDEANLDEREREIEQLRRELTASKEYLQSLTEQQDAANEELRSANEEILSSNEELQSTNEQLETAKEELQSANEELMTVNDQLRQRNRELNELTDDLTNLLTNAAIPVVMVGADLRIRRFTAAAKKIMRLMPGDVGRPVIDLRTSLDTPDLGSLIEEVIDQVQPREREVRDSGGRYYIMRIHPYRTADRKIEGAVLVLVDIDDIKKAQNTLAQNAELLELIHEAIFVREWNGPIVYWNRGAAELYGYTAQEAVGQLSDELLQTGEYLDRPTLEAQLDRQGHWVGELMQQTRDGRQVIVESRQQIVTRSGGSRFVLETNRDITERKKLAEDLRRSVEELKAADRQKNDFLGTLAHELRNPLAPVLNAVELLHVKGLSEDEAAWCRDVLDRQLKQMARLLDDLLDVGRIASGRMELRTERVELPKVIETAIETSRPFIDAAGHKVTVKMPSEPIFVDADSARLAQVFSNLINNAAKYTRRAGEIAITGERRNGQAVISVKDNGIGIPPEFLPRIFDLFVQEEYSTGSETSGLGVGLTLVRKLVELHGGSVEARSAGRDQGSEFIVRLPVVNNASAPSTTAGSAGAAVPRRRILIVDDRPEQTRTMRMVLERMGHEAHVANDGASALRVLEEFPCDIAFIDIGLRGMSGYDLARRIRERPKFKDMILIAQTGWGRDEDRQRSREAGFDHHLVKPIDRRLLAEVLADLPRRQEGTLKP